MTCEDALLRIHAYADGELDVGKSLEVEGHLEDCSECTSELASLRALRTAFSDASFYFEAPSRLERRIRAAVHDVRRAEGGRGRMLMRLAGGGAAAAAVLLGVILIRGLPPVAPAATELIAQEAVDDHLRALAAGRLTDVLSSNQHTVKPWFDGKLSFTPPVKDLGAEGFTLIGGRIDYLADRQVAAVVYRIRQHVIDLFVAPAADAQESSPRSQVRQGYNVVDWTTSGMSYWAVSSVSAPELERFAELIRVDSSKRPER